MEEFLRYLIEKIVDKSDAIVIQKVEDDMVITFTISVNQADFGRIIGKKGKTINSIRTLLTIYGYKNNETTGKKIFVKVNEPPENEIIV